MKIGVPEELRPSNNNIAMKNSIDVDKINSLVNKEVAVAKSAKDHGKLSKDDFLKLLTVQIKNQDPMQPMEQHKFAAELAQFSQLEQLANINQNIEKNNDTKTILMNSSLNYLGKYIVRDMSKLKFNGQENVDLKFTVDRPLDKILFSVQDEKGNEIFSKEIPASKLGENSFNWDFRAQDGKRVETGTYSVKFTGSDLNNKKYPIVAEKTDRIDGMDLSDGTPKILVDGEKISFNEIKKIFNKQENIQADWNTRRQ